MAPDRSSPPDILVVGDVMLDRYLEGGVERMSPEAPVPVLRVQRTFERPGGAANTAVNIAALGGAPLLVGTTGRDPVGASLRALVEAAGVSSVGLLEADASPTTQKTRLLSGHQQIARFDQERPLQPAELPATLGEVLDARLPRARCAVISDYAKGVCDGAVCRRVIDTCSRHGTPVIVDPKGNDFAKYSGADVITPNQREAAAVVGFPIREPDEGIRAARRIRESFGVRSVVITLGEKGLVVVGPEGTAALPTAARRVCDVTGAGDTVVAMLAVALAEGTALEEACHLANAAAGLQVARVGATTVTRREVSLALGRRTTAADKIVDLDRLVPALRRARAEGRRIGFTNGCFDLLHHGHAALLEAAANECDELVVGINSDASVRRLKGPSRPIVPAPARETMLAALASVAWVCAFDEDTPLELIRAIEPDVLLKGADYALADVVGADVVLGRGGRVVLVPLVPQVSTTNLLARLSPHRG